MIEAISLIILLQNFILIFEQFLAQIDNNLLWLFCVIAVILPQL